MNSDIDFRNLCLDIESFAGNESIDEMHDRFVKGATAMGTAAIRSALIGSGLSPDEIDFLVVATCTGYICPGLSAVYAKEVGFSNRLQRADLVGMGCAGALPALQRAHDFVKANPGKKALVVTVEVCSACYYLDDSLETIIGNAICADGAAAMVVGMRDGDLEMGDEVGLEEEVYPRIVGFRTLLETSYIDKGGFQQKEGRLRIVLSKDLRDTAGGLVRQVVDGPRNARHLLRVGHLELGGQLRRVTTKDTKDTKGKDPCSLAAPVPENHSLVSFVSFVVDQRGF